MSPAGRCLVRRCCLVSIPSPQSPRRRGGKENTSGRNAGPRVEATLPGREGGLTCPWMSPQTVTGDETGWTLLSSAKRSLTCQRELCVLTGRASRADAAFAVAGPHARGRGALPRRARKAPGGDEGGGHAVECGQGAEKARGLGRRVGCRAVAAPSGRGASGHSPAGTRTAGPLRSNHRGRHPARAKRWTDQSMSGGWKVAHCSEPPARSSKGE